MCQVGVMLGNNHPRETRATRCGVQAQQHQRKQGHPYVPSQERLVSRGSQRLRNVRPKMKGRSIILRRVDPREFRHSTRGMRQREDKQREREKMRWDRWEREKGYVFLTYLDILIYPCYVSTVFPTSFQQNLAVCSVGSWRCPCWYTDPQSMSRLPKKSLRATCWERESCVVKCPSTWAVDGHCPVL